MDIIYKHNKTGNLYKILWEAQHTETKEILVIYQNVDGGQVWARNYKQFHELVTIDGKQIPRFELVKD